MSIERDSREILGREVSLLRAGQSLSAGGGPALLFLHGVPTNSALRLPVLGRLEGVCAVAPDLPGFGASDTPHNPSISAYHRFTSELARVEGLRDFVLVGHDLGGLYALTYALAHPHRLRALVLLNTTIYPDPMVALALVPLLAPGFGETYSWLAGSQRYRELVVRGLATMYPRETPSDVLRELTAPYGQTSSWLSLVRAFRGLNPLRVLGWKRRMAGLELPVLILWGEGDPYFPPSVPERMQRDLPDSRLEYVPNGGHFLMLKRPRETTEAILRFLERV